MIGMGSLSVSGSDKLSDAFARIQDIPFSVTSEALDAMAEVAVREIRDTGETMGVRDENSDVHILDHLITKKAKEERRSATAERGAGETPTRATLRSPSSTSTESAASRPGLSCGRRSARTPT